MKIISVVNQKGGCGKTITAVNLSAALSKRGHKVLLIDLDPQGHATFSLNKKDALPITDILEKICQKKDLPWQEIGAPISDNFYFIPSSLGLASLEHNLANKDDKLQVLSSFLQKLSLFFEICVLDCPPSLGIITLNALEASKYSLVPLSMCDFSIQGLEKLKDIIVMLKEFNGTVPACFYLLTQTESRSKFSREFTKRVKNQLGGLLLNSSIRANIHLREATSGGKNIFEYMPDSRGARDYSALAQEIEKIICKTTHWAPLFFKGNSFQELYAVGDFNNWQKEEKYKFRKVGYDIWSVNIPLEKGRHRYKFATENSWLIDPYNNLSEDDSFGGKNSLIYVE